MILGAGCASNPCKVNKSEFILEPRPDPIPKIIDGSPKRCPECIPVNGQPMVKFTERDFKADLDKHMENQDYMEYQRSLLEDE